MRCAISLLWLEPELVAAVLDRATNTASYVHGPDHWERVATVGLHLAAQTPGADPEAVLLFALFHDAMRLSDGADPDHGRRAAALVTELLPTHATLREACELHVDGLTSDDPTIGVCWDADRLDLPRVGVEPSPALLSTVAAIQAVIHRDRLLGRSVA